MARRTRSSESGRVDRDGPLIFEIPPVRGSATDVPRESNRGDDSVPRDARSVPRSRTGRRAGSNAPATAASDRESLGVAVASDDAPALALGFAEPKSHPSSTILPAAAGAFDDKEPSDVMHGLELDLDPAAPARGSAPATGAGAGARGRGSRSRRKAAADEAALDLLDSESPDVEVRDGDDAEAPADAAAPGRGRGGSNGGLRRPRATAESMAKAQREISVSEFFAKNRHLLGFDNPRKAMLTTVKEAVDNSLDACEEAGILPEIQVEILQLDENRFRILVRDNGPGIVRKQIDNIFGKLLYGSKFHRLKMSRGQQGIGISAAGMYGLMTTGKPVVIISKTKKGKPAHIVELKMDTSKNRADVVSETEMEDDAHIFPEGHGTQVVIELEGRYLKGRQSIDEYIEQTAIANPHARFIYHAPTGERVIHERTVDELPPEAEEIQPHPKGIELGTLIQMIERTEHKQLGAFFKEEFCRVGPSVASEICEKAGLTSRTWVKQVGHKEAEALYKAIQEVRIMAPPTNCVVPIGTKTLLAGLLKEVHAEFYSASTRPPTVYRGRPFTIEAAVAYGGDLPGDEPARVIRFANRVPLLYQQSACSSYKSVVETNWRNYGLSQPKNAVPQAPLVVMIHMASVWVPFTSESKEAIADYDEIRKEMRLALQECGRKLMTYLRRRQRMRRQGDRRNVFLRYIGEISKACEAITGRNAEDVYEALMKQAQAKTAEADQILDDEGRVIDDGGSLARDDGVVIRDDVIRADEAHLEPSANGDLFDDGAGGGEDVDSTVPARGRSGGRGKGTKRPPRKREKK